MAEFVMDETVDITDVVCLVTFVKAKVALEELDDGQVPFFMKNTPSKSTERLIFFAYLRSLGLYNGRNYSFLHGNIPKL